jgi:hypothetical protein
VATYLLTWNPDRWSWPEDDIEGAIAALDGGRSFRMDWSTGNTKSTQPGDRFYLMRLGPEPRGIFASGIIVSENRETSHWDEAKAREGKTSRMASLDFIELIMTPLGQEKLRQAAPGVEWSPQSSGIKIPPESVLEIEKLWQTHLHEQGVPLRLVNDVEQARLSLRLFWQQMQAGHEVVKEQAWHVEKFVYEAERDGFSPQWWCGYRGMTVETCEALAMAEKETREERPIRSFQKGRGSERLKNLLQASSQQDEELVRKLAENFERTFPKKKKWFDTRRLNKKLSFLRLPPAAPDALVLPASRDGATQSPTVYQVLDRDGRKLDARFEIEGPDIVFHSRSGRKGGGGTNEKYGEGLLLLLERAVAAGVSVADAFVDSETAQDLSEDERRIVDRDNIPTDPKELRGVFSRKMKGIGRGPGAKGSGNSTKRIRIRLEPDLGSHLLGVLEGAIDGGLSTEDTEWVEGKRTRVSHLRRERDSKAARRKRQEFKKEHGKLFCERCRYDPAIDHGEYGDACIEVHHTIPLAEQEGPRSTQLEDLQCLCANCHRVVHRYLRAGENPPEP